MTVSSVDCDLVDGLFYEELLPKIEDGLKKIEDNAAFQDGIDTIRSIEIALTVLEKGEAHTHFKTLQQYRWSWIIWSMIGPFYQLLPGVEVYSREKVLEQIKKNFEELFAENNIANKDLLTCVIKANIAHFFSKEFLLFLHEVPEEICTHTWVARDIGDSFVISA